MVVSTAESDNWIDRLFVAWEILGSMILGWMVEDIDSGIGREIARSLRKSGSWDVFGKV